MSQVFGRAFITVAGKRYNTKEGASLKFGGVSREAVVGDAGVAGYQEKIEAPQVDCTIIHTANISLKEIQGIKNATISFDTDNGKSFVITNGFCLGLRNCHAMALKRPFRVRSVRRFK